MAVKVQQLRSSTASKRPTTSDLLAGEVALNLNAGTPGLFFENASADGVIKVGPAEVGSSAPNSAPASGGSSANTTGEFWYDTNTSALKVCTDGGNSTFVAAGSITIGTTEIELGGDSNLLNGLENVTSDLLTLPGSTSGSVSLAAPAVAGTQAYVLPLSYGSAGQQLTTGGNGTLTWSNADNDPTQIVSGDNSVSVDDNSDTITFETNGVDRWIVDAAGNFEPQADNSYSIGNSTTGTVANVYASALHGQIQDASQTNITGVGTITTGTWNADIVGAAYGGSGLDGSSAANGTLLIGNGSGYTLAALTEGQSIGITNGSGTISLDADIATAGAGSGTIGVASFESTDFVVSGGHVSLSGSGSANQLLTDSGTATAANGQLNVNGTAGVLATSGSGNTVVFDLVATAVTAAAYGAADTVGTFTVDGDGRLTAAADVAISILHGAVSDFDAGVQENTLDSLAAPVASVAMNSQTITGLADPVNAQDAATKSYVDSTAQGLDTKASVKAASVGNVAGSYDNGASGVGATLTNNGTQAAFTLDGDTLSAGDRVLLKDQTAVAQNGVYSVTTVGDGSTNWVITRTIDMDDSDEFSGSYFFVEGGNVNASNGYVCVSEEPIVIGTTSIIFEQFSGAGQVEAGAGLTKSGNTLNVGGTADRITVNPDTVDIASTYVGQASITTLGTITTGVWNGTIVGTLYGGTGADGSNVAEGYVLAAPTVGSGSGNVTYRALNTDDIQSGNFDAGSY